MIAEFLGRLGYNSFTFDVIFAIIFIILLSIFLYVKRKQVTREKMLFPIIYAFLFRGKFGIKWMEKFSKKYKESIKLFGYISIGFGFFGMLLAILLVLYVTFQLIFQPKAASVAPFLPFVEVPVLGYISFSHWIITIFILVLFHEAAHGIVALAHNLKIKNTGFGVFAIFAPLFPAAFVEPDEKEIVKQSDVVQYSIFSAGPMANFVLMIPLLLIMLLLINPVESAMTTQDGFTFDVIDDESYPAFNSGIADGTVFNSLNGQQVETIDDFYAELYWMKPGQNITLSYVDQSGNAKYAYELKLVQNPENSEKGFLGITQLRNNILIKDSAKAYAPFFSWLKGLFTLLFNITLSLGIINLFPATITDGGRMFSLALNKISKNKKLNAKIIGLFAIFFLIVIFFAMITFFTGNPFSFLFN